MFITGCEKLKELRGKYPPVIDKPPVEVPVKIDPVVPVPPQDSTPHNFAWGTTHPDWDKALSEAVDASALKPEVKKPCKKLSAKECLKQAISIMAKYESSFKPETSYKEGFNDASGNAVISRGLLQISIESANQKAYGCAIKTANDLHNPKTNLECAVRIAVKWINQDGEFFGSAKNGLGRYWHVGRATSSSNGKIISYLENL